jgi:chromosome segregation ATPase
MIVRLERALTEERENSASLRKTAEDLRFKMQVLEQSYAKQLENARRRCEAAEQSSSEAAARISELEAAQEENLQLLNEAQEQLHRVKGQRDQMMGQPGSRQDWPLAASTREQEWYEEGTINALMDDDKWSRKRAPAADAPPLPSKPVEQDDTVEDLISPDWAFTTDRARD